MNKIIISAVLALVSLSAKAADTNTLCIKSTLKGFYSDTLIVYSSNHRDTILVKNDSFTATFITLLLRGVSPAECHAKAVEVSAYVCTQAGAVNPLPEGLL